VGQVGQNDTPPFVSDTAITSRVLYFVHHFWHGLCDIKLAVVSFIFLSFQKGIQMSNEYGIEKYKIEPKITVKVESMQMNERTIVFSVYSDKKENGRMMIRNSRGIMYVMDAHTIRSVTHKMPKVYDVIEVIEEPTPVPATPKPQGKATVSKTRVFNAPLTGKMFRSNNDGVVKEIENEENNGVRLFSTPAGRTLVFDPAVTTVEHFLVDTGVDLREKKDQGFLRSCGLTFGVIA
jgi:hypothetical protein